MDIQERYNPFTGKQVIVGEVDSVPAAAALGLEPPRFCEQCGRRMVVQVHPEGWWARCSRHGELNSKTLDHR